MVMSIVTGSMPFETYPLRGRSVTHVQDDAVVTDARAMAAAKEAGLPWIRGGLVEYACGVHHGVHGVPAGGAVLP